MNIHEKKLPLEMTFFVSKKKYFLSSLSCGFN